MAYNPKKKYEKMLRALKRKSKTNTIKQKQEYVKNCAKRMDNNPTVLESKFIEMLNELKINFETQKVIQYKIFDFYIPSINTLIELDGSYWHGYGKTLLEMNHIQKKTYYNDKRKDTLARGLGYNLIRIWEHELDDENYNLTKENIKRLLQ